MKLLVPFPKRLQIPIVNPFHKGPRVSRVVQGLSHVTKSLKLSKILPAFYQLCIIRFPLIATLCSSLVRATHMFVLPTLFVLLTYSYHLRV